MIIIPAIDLFDNCAVRLFKGNYKEKKIYSSEPWKLAEGFAKNGATLLHLVDLNGARNQLGINEDSILKIRKTTSLKVQLGGGIRDKEKLAYYDKIGIDRFILGTAAVTDPDLLKFALDNYEKERVVVAVDAIDGIVKIAGWEKDSGVRYRDLMDRLAKAGIEHIVFTDIAQDGTLAGPNLKAYQEILNSYPFQVIASGGISSLKDLMDLSSLKTKIPLYGVITGKALYEGKLDLAKAISSI
ncbi:1-(5-phosphoribosyl)-5-[(5-phosphoribosylamino)methylideneamino]imidazole-4-carboxamide isomerase [Leptospira borgpetersenii serovar Hardjo-bovis]|uniref:1-(5-phosphoribosyl)-5-[(5-phosphoribosylamino)methylideneamino] imidazole-4-carboxamide isomerase n=2 Tax=Leptospira borgpetersenii serovar Hardjo-bovis TaxID=338217 RepID=HIS4_LEPBL|nr:1-(5-phosphoribosyl)-5-[(5-phosphoribosylamino)methylideneamino]imidazole-4-carboxamide isomerase [Leptospira borgpetersenii]Q056S8.1 RecName: Full=1-(5-phosphoribosyl)-5-[(5-phosphoribosylamino)methylideneamino] imidazole-4-carboxamide isomerase; AltName: Full=Phosphoribosylformimino-5-aminoimidazole carboxamide ribotide isomerase [Leptospira borgpetersenii serovar Hardjo-bovis str. L550]ABJ77667.1 1-(5-phosphoribosyl)-5-[(5- phosphoribosylamino)methylideneamino] imidazole-4- carboxamide isom